MNNKHVDILIDIVLDARKAIMKIYDKDFNVFIKEDKSPLTEADLISSKIICDGLKKLTPKIPIICEETKNEEYDKRKDWEYFWLVDPIDGTKEFIKKNGEFTINIGLVKNNSPIFGIVDIPCEETIYYATLNRGAYKINKDMKKERIYCNKFTLKDDKLRIAMSKSHKGSEDKVLKKLKNPKCVNYGSSIKFLKVAEGSIDLYPRFKPCMEWDTCASHIIVNEAGGKILICDDHNKDNLLESIYKNNKELVYNKKDLHSPYFICYGGLFTILP